METVKEKNEKKKEYLKQYGKALHQEKRIEEELERLKLDRMLPGALAADGLPKSSNLSDLSDYAAKLDELIREMNQERYQLVQAAVLINRAISEVPEGIERYVLTKKYLLCWRWERIADGLGYSVRSVYYIHGRGLHKLQVPEEWKKETEEAS